MKVRGETARTSQGMLSALQSFTESDAVPGSSYVYSNIGYVCLARIVEIASDEPFESFSARRIFAPLGMAETRYWPGPDSIPGGAVPVEPDPVLGFPCSLGDGGLWTTVNDFQLWNDAMNLSLLGVSGMVQQTVMLNNGTPLDYAWGIRRIERNNVTGWSHGGSWPGIFAKAVRFPALRSNFVAFTLDTDIEPILRLTDCVQDLLIDPIYR